MWRRSRWCIRVYTCMCGGAAGPNPQPEAMNPIPETLMCGDSTGSRVRVASYVSLLIPMPGSTGSGAPLVGTVVTDTLTSRYLSLLFVTQPAQGPLLALSSLILLLLVTSCYCSLLSRPRRAPVGGGQLLEPVADDFFDRFRGAPSV